MYMLNLHRIEKDVHRCDRNYWYFTTANLEKLRNIMCRLLQSYHINSEEETLNDLCSFLLIC